ncbi:uncharacterized protein LOC108907417 [Anoplophora glabripennis]|uniref:uncharacterized protein LOC108907417 n=1 Tax=Anoplophora glabripennis TaxID=217634 RepID=UPI000874FF77|nr:uncharacterized protein LOC108907417 [Anoplophora glabripennis]
MNDEKELQCESVSKLEKLMANQWADIHRPGPINTDKQDMGMNKPSRSVLRMFDPLHVSPEKEELKEISKSIEELPKNYGTIKTEECATSLAFFDEVTEKIE